MRQPLCGSVRAVRGGKRVVHIEIAELRDGELRFFGGAFSAYQAALAGIPGVRLLDYDPAERNSHHYIVAEIGPDCPASRDDLIAALHSENVLARKYFWPGCHGMQPYRDLFPHAGLVLPNTSKVAESVLILPNGLSLDSPAIGTICDIVRSVAR